MASSDEAKNHKNAHGKKIARPIHLVQFAEAEKRSQDTGMRNIYALQLPVTPLPESLDTGFSTTPWPESRDIQPATSLPEALPASIEHWPTQPQLQTVVTSSPFALMIDGLLISEQPTMITPVVGDVNKAPGLEDQNTGSQSYASLMRNLIKSSGIYALASVASPLVSLVLAPFLTRSLSHADYGALAVLNTMIALGAGLTQLGLSSAFFRAYNYDYESREDRLGIFSTVVILLSLTSISVTVAALIAAPWLTLLLFNDLSFSNPIRIVALVILLQNLTVPGFAWLRAENRAASFSLLSVANLLVSLSATFIFVGVLHLGIAGSLLAVGSGYVFVVVCMLPLILLRAGLKFRFDIAHNLLSFGVPLVFNFVSYWVLQLSDRYLLSRLGSLSQTASYAVAYSLGGVLSVVVLSPFILAWPSAMFAIAKRDNAVRVFRRVFRWFGMLLLFAAFAFSFTSIAALDILFPPAYHSSAPVIPIVATSIIFYGVYNVFAVGVGVQRKTWFTALFMTLAALVNVGFNIILIPLYGSMGAAISTLFAYAFLALITYIVNQRIYPIPFEIGRFMLAFLIGIALYVGGSFLARSQGIYGTVALYFGVLALYGGCLLFLGRFPLRKLKQKYRQTKEIFLYERILPH